MKVHTPAKSGNGQPIVDLRPHLPAMPLSYISVYIYNLLLSHPPRADLSSSFILSGLPSPAPSSLTDHTRPTTRGGPHVYLFHPYQTGLAAYHRTPHPASSGGLRDPSRRTEWTIGNGLRADSDERGVWRIPCLLQSQPIGETKELA